MSSSIHQKEACVASFFVTLLLLRRPVLSIFNAVYESEPRKVKFSNEIAAELYSAVQLAPFLRRNWFRRFQSVHRPTNEESSPLVEVRRFVLSDAPPLAPTRFINL